MRFSGKLGLIWFACHSDLSTAKPTEYLIFATGEIVVYAAEVLPRADDAGNGAADGEVERIQSAGNQAAARYCLITFCAPVMQARGGNDVVGEWHARSQDRRCTIGARTGLPVAGLMGGSATEKSRRTEILARATTRWKRLSCVCRRSS